VALPGAAVTVRFLEGLTDSSIRSLIVATLDASSLGAPTRPTWAKVAQALELSRSTFGEPFRQSQRKLLESSDLLHPGSVRGALPRTRRTYRLSGEIPAIVRSSLSRLSFQPGTN
jgi:hypothetical protein